MTEYRPPYREGALLGLAIFGLYIVTLSPTTAWWDASEYITTGHLLGCSSPAGESSFRQHCPGMEPIAGPVGVARRGANQPLGRRH